MSLSRLAKMQTEQEGFWEQLYGEAEPRSVNFTSRCLFNLRVISSNSDFLRASEEPEPSYASIEE